MGKFFGQFDIYMCVCVYRYNEVYIILYYIYHISCDLMGYMQKSQGWKLSRKALWQTCSYPTAANLTRRTHLSKCLGRRAIQLHLAKLYTPIQTTCVCLRNPHIWTSRLEITRKANVLFGARGILVPSFFGPTPLLTTLSVAHHQTNKRADPRLSLVRRGHHQFQHGASMGRVETWISRAFHSQE